MKNFLDGTLHIGAIGILAAGCLLCNVATANAQTSTATGQVQESIPLLFGQLQAQKYGYVQQQYGQLLARQNEALPYLKQKANSGDLLARALVLRMTQPQKYAAFAQKLTVLGKQFNNVDDPEDTLTPEEQEEAAKEVSIIDPVAQRIRQQRRRSSPRVIRLDWGRLGKWLKNKPGPLPGLEGPDVVAFLVERLSYEDSMLDESDVTTPLAIFALARTKDPQAFDTLAYYARSKQKDLMPEGMEALRVLGDKRALPLLADILYVDAKEKQRYVPGQYIAPDREQAAKVLGEIGDASVLGVLDTAAAQDEAITVREYARDAATAIRQRAGLTAKK